MILSPINYMGSKRRLLKQILPLFPNNIDTFYDLFAGSLTVTINTKANHYIVNDLNYFLINMLKELINLSDDELSKMQIDLAKYEDREYFLEQRELWNSDKDNSFQLWKLIVSSFNGLPRFNKKGNYNMPWANTDRLTDTYFNSCVKKLSDYCHTMQGRDITFSSKSFDKVVDFNKVTENDFIYLDPPYLGTTTTYNDKSRDLDWTVDNERQLYSFLTILLKHNIKFAYSNVLTHRGVTNELLANFINKYEEQIKVHHLNMDYSNSTYHTKSGKSDEILITNY